MLVVRVSWWIVLGLMVQGCTGSFRALSRQHESEVVSPQGKLDFGWKLSGTRSIAPLQVFSDKNRIWLQWSPQQPMPVILAKSDEGEQVLSYTRQDPYTIVSGHWPRLIFRAGGQQANARHVQSTQDSGNVNQDFAESASTRKAPSKDVAAQDRPVVQVANTPLFSVSPEDQNLRQTLVRWSGISGWYFQPEHWGVDVDIPLAGGARFGDDYIASVQALVSSTELSDRPLQPCFYSNQVLRIIALSESCDRTMTPVVGGAPA